MRKGAPLQLELPGGQIFWEIPAYEYPIDHSTCKLAAFLPTICHN